MTELAQSLQVRRSVGADAFLWQGTAIRARGAGADAPGRRPASVRYAIGVAALAAMVAAPSSRFSKLTAVRRTCGADHGGCNRIAGPAGRWIASNHGSCIAGAGHRIRRQSSSAAVVACLLAGVVLFSVRLLGGWIVARRMGSPLR